ncbi:MAG: ABC transporter permease [Anaerolineaceae bacterium]|nr:ABC transporter permease [Anaerolineaceae bacterium]
MEALELLTNLLASTLRLATPLLLTAMACLLSYQVGLINIAVEGLMLSGCFIAVVAGAQIGYAWGGVLLACIVGAAMGALFALFVTTLRADLIVTGLAMNFFVLGATAYLLQILFGVYGSYTPGDLKSLPIWRIPVLSEIPFLGKAFFQHPPLIYVSWLAIPLTAILLYRTRAGLHIRAVGVNEEAARTAGISVTRIRYLALTLGGLLCGLGGAHLAVGELALFRENMTGGRGFIGLAAVYFAAGRPVLAALACLLFGFFEALQFRLQTTVSIPYQFFQMLPYLMVVIMMVLISVRENLRRGRGGI